MAAAPASAEVVTAVLDSISNRCVHVPSLRSFTRSAGEDDKTLDFDWRTREVSKTPPEDSSYRQILRSSSIIGGASVINIVVGLLRIKFTAVLLGPSGIGLIGLLHSVVTTASAVSSFGFGNVGTRQVAEAVGRKDAQGVDDARRALFWGTLALAVTGGALVWALRDDLREQVIGDPVLSHSSGWLGLAVALTVASGSQAALLNGLRRIGDLARVGIASAILSTALGIGALLVWGEGGVLAFVVSAPLASFIVGHWYVAKLPPIRGRSTPLPVLAAQWKTLLQLGTAFMIPGIVGSAALLAVRTIVQRDLGADALGQFQASWIIAMTYIGLVLGAMSVDFYPRLVEIIDDHAAANRVVNEQSEVSLLMAGPVLLAMLALAPWVLQLMYSREFAEAAVILRWQLLADVLKVASWPLGYIILAAGDGRTFVLAETFATVVLVLLVWIGLPIIGVEATGVALIGQYIIYLPLVYWLARKRTGFAWSSRVKRHAFVLMIAAIVVFALGSAFEVVGAAVGLIITLAFGFYSFDRLAHMSEQAAVIRVAAICRSLLERMRFWRD